MKVVDFETSNADRWIARAAPFLSLPLKWTVLAGGHSNLTYLLEDANGNRLVLRRPPVGDLLPKAHDVAREWRIISALAKTTVKVPGPIAFCDDKEVMGADFYLMEYVDGRTLHFKGDVEAYVPYARRREVAMAFIDQLAQLHSVDPRDVGLERLASPKGYIERQISRWHQSWVSNVEAARYDDPRAHDQRRALQSRIPEQGPPTIVHGDYGLHNTLISREGSVAAVIDWEIATLGEPLADVAYALNRFPADGIQLPADTATMAPGFPTREEMAERYAQRTGRDLAHLAYLCAFNAWKSAAILHGVYARYLAAGRVPADGDLDKIRHGIGDRLANAQNYLAKVQ